MLMDTRPPRGSSDAEPWRYEPDRVAWHDSATGFQCLILRAGLGNLCGYVRVPRGHALHGKHFSHRRVCRGLYVHGGLTFSGHLGGRRMRRGHWFGFDCGHFCDYVPAFADAARFFGLPVWRGTYRTVDFVRAECTVLAQQLADRNS